MANQSSFRAIIEFMAEIGVYDVILPFLLVFTIIFAILEKTKILGVEKVGTVETTKKNINSIVAFVIAFLVIASVQLVTVINRVMADVVLLLILAICFLMLVGSLYKTGELDFTDKHKSWTKVLVTIMFIGVVVIFLNALDWLQYILALFVFFDTAIIGAILFVVIIIGFMVYITWDKRPSSGTSGGSGGTR